jgi:hypothetical protein
MKRFALCSALAMLLIAASATDYTAGANAATGFYKANALPIPRRVILMGPGVTLEQDAIFTSTGASVTGPVSLQLAWTIPAGTTTLTIPVVYSAGLDVSGARPYAKLRGNTSIGISEQTVTAPSGGGSQTITITFSATSAAGVAIVDLVVPSSGLTGTVTWSPVVQSGQSANIGPSGGAGGNGNGGSGVKGSGGAHIIGGGG